MKLRLEDGAKIGLCVKGQRRFCEQHGIDFRRLAREGIPFEELSHIEDGNLKAALEAAEKREAGDGR